jgi:hypothetical protein
MKYETKTIGYAETDYKTNTDIAKELNITPEKKKKYRNTEEICCNIQTECLMSDNRG